MRHAALASRVGVAQSTVTRAIHGDTHARVPFPLEIDYSGPRPAGSPRYHPYEEAVELLARASADEVEMVEHLGRLGVRGLLRLLDHLPGFDPDLIRRQTSADARTAILGLDNPPTDRSGFERRSEALAAAERPSPNGAPG
jgi:hypothetical protein